VKHLGVGTDSRAAGRPGWCPMAVCVSRVHPTRCVARPVSCPAFRPRSIAELRIADEAVPGPRLSRVGVGLGDLPFVCGV